MNSLNDHLRAGSLHDSLAFHSSCPICRERRLHGRLDATPLVPARAQAAIVAGFIATSAVSPPALALAAEPDRTDDGSAVVSTAPADPAASSDFDPGGDDTALPDEPPIPAQPASAPAAAEDSGPVDAAPAGDETDPDIDPRGSTSPSQSDPTTATPTTPTPAATAPIDDPAPAAPIPSPVTPTPVASVAPVTASTGTPTNHGAKKKTAARTQPRRETTVATVPVVATVRQVTTASPATTTAASTAPEQLPASATTHVVKPGETLWAIANAALGGHASPAQIAREVHHLWQLNRDRIGTGSPDLLMVGTRLELR